MNLSVKNCFLFFITCLMSTQLIGQSVGGTTSGGGTFCDSVNAGFITVAGYTGTIIDWESSTDGGLTWNSTSNNLSFQSYNNLSQTTCYHVIVQNGAFAPDTSTVSCVTVFLPSVGGTISGAGTFCVTSGTGTLTLSGNNGNVLFWQSSTDNGSTWTNISNTTTTENYSNITQNTIYSAVVQNGSTCPTDTSAFAYFNIDLMTVPGSLSGSDTFCYGFNSGLISLSGYFGTILNWISSVDSGATWSSISNNSALYNYDSLSVSTVFGVIVKNGICPSDTSGFAEIFIRDIPLADAGNDTTIIEGQSVILNGSGTGTPVWTPSSSLSSSFVFLPVATPVSTTNYVLTITDLYGCTDNDAVLVTVLPPVFTGMISNLFTPNNDGVNDTWYIQDIQNFPENEVMVFNIYGDEGFVKKGYNNDWQGTYNGSPLPDGTYFYVLKFEDSPTVIKGSIDILRSK
jgi:gliding motility-associated-like protein